jgi:hypothetical protein
MKHQSLCFGFNRHIHRHSSFHCHVRVFCVLLCSSREAESKITTGLYVGEGSENRQFRIFDPFPRPTGLGPGFEVGRGNGSKIRKGLFSDPSPIQTEPTNNPRSH